MIDQTRDKLYELYGINAKYYAIGASIDELPNGSRANFSFHCEIYKADTGDYYAVITSDGELPDDSTIVHCLNTYKYVEEYDIYADYTPIEPSSPLQGLRVYKLSPKMKKGEAQRMSENYDL